MVAKMGQLLGTGRWKAFKFTVGTVKKKRIARVLEPTWDAGPGWEAGGMRQDGGEEWWRQ